MEKREMMMMMGMGMGVMKKEQDEEGNERSCSFGAYDSNSNKYCSSLSSVFDLDEEVEKSSLGFMDLLELSPVHLDYLNLPTKESAASISKEQPPPTTPNSSSISSASSDAEPSSKTQLHQNTAKQLKAKKTKQKKQREARFAFMTKSEVDHLEDGYRWRKYGQKAVKHSPFPRSYYRCTSASCNVKKRVERSFSDPTVVVTTYEGQHTHPSPLIPRSSSLALPATTSLSTSSPAAAPNNTFSFPRFDHHSASSTTPPDPPPPYCNLSLRDHGLLQDIIPSHMLKQE